MNNPVNLTARSSSTVAIENVSGSNTLGGSINLGAGGAQYWIQSDAGQLTLSGGTAISVGPGTTGTRTVTLLGAGNGLISGALTNGNSGTLALTMAGSGTWTLSGTNTYTGLTEVTGGTLVVSSPTALADGANLFVGAAASFFAPVVPQQASAVSPVPEPGTLALMAAGALTAAVALRRKKRKVQKPGVIGTRIPRYLLLGTNRD